MIKRSLDLILSAVGLALLSPLLLAVAIAIKSEDGGPVLYGGVRVGLRGRPFRMLKFRSMVVDADRLGGPSTAGDDPRLTAIGRRIRQYKLDELPQLVNVLRGEMSLVGPRPEVPEYVELFTTDEQAILGVRPGITDWASLWNSDEGAVLAGHADPDAAYLTLIRPTKLRLQLLYVRERSLWMDVQIIALTTLRVLGWDYLPPRIRGVAGRAPAAVER